MDHTQLDALIDELESLIPNERGIFFRLEKRDWGSVFAKAKEIQCAFNAKVRYPTVPQRELAWVRFNDLRSLAFERSNSERHRFRHESAEKRDEILSMLKGAMYNRLADDTVAFITGGLGAFGYTTADDVKRMGEIARGAGQLLSENKSQMLKEHKSECFERILEVRQSHDAFWSEYRRGLEEKRQESRQKREQIAERIGVNLSKNRESLSKALGAYERVEANIEANREKLASARSAGFAETVAGWIEEGQDKLRSISESIERIQSWIKEDEERQNSIHRRL